LRERKLLQNGVFQHLCGAETDDGLGLDLDLFAGLRVATDASLAMSLDNAADAGDDELSGGALGFLHSELVELFKESGDGFLGRAEFLSDMRNDFGLTEWLSCHLVCLSS